MTTSALGTSVNRNLFLVCLVAGVVALTLGVREAESIDSAFSRLFTGALTDKALWLLAGGVICTVAGLIGLARGSR